MTQRVKGLLVSLEHDIREDEIKYIINAIGMVKGVQSVTINTVNQDDWLNRARIKNQIESKIYQAISDVFKEIE